MGLSAVPLFSPTLSRVLGEPEGQRGQIAEHVLAQRKMRRVGYVVAFRVLLM